MDGRLSSGGSGFGAVSLATAAEESEAIGEEARGLPARGFRCNLFGHWSNSQSPYFFCL